MNGVQKKFRNLISKKPIDNTARTARIHKIPWMQLEKIQNTIPVVLGCGMNGHYVILNFATLGVKKIIVIDPDRLAPTDLGKTLFPEHHAKRKTLKVDAIKAMVRAVNPSVAVSSYPMSFSVFPKSIILDLLNNGSAIFPIITVDNRKTMLQASLFFRLLNQTSYMGALTAPQLKSQVYVSRPDSGCIACLFTEEDYNFLSIQESCTGEAGAPALNSVAAQCSSGIIHEIFKNSMSQLDAQTEESYKIVFSSLQGFESLSIPVSGRCRYHYSSAKKVISAKKEWTLDTLFKQCSQSLNSAENDIHLSFALQDKKYHLSARCSKCGSVFPLGSIDRQGKRCSQCNEKNKILIPDRYQEKITKNDLTLTYPEQLNQTLNDIGLLSRDVLFCSTSSKKKSVLIRIQK
ncbi:ThiF family adenylyltransferase [bacterium]|nr:ThiF family adenylyltransferase [bacterium]